MINDLKNLLALQEVDLRILELEKSKEEFPVKVVELEKTISDAAAVVENTGLKIEEMKTEKKEVEDQIENAKISLERSQERLNTIRTNKEYDAVHSEIETHKHIVSGADKRLQKFANEIEALQTQLEEEETAHKQLLEENQPQIDELKATIATIDSSIAEVVSERDKLSPLINKQFVRTYDHIRATRKRGTAISVVDNVERNCTVCFMVVPPQHINQMRKGPNLVFCQGCGSILIWEGSLTESSTVGENSSVE